MKTNQGSGINLSAFGASRRPRLAVAEDQGDGAVRVQLVAAPGFEARAKLSDRAADLFREWSKALVDAPKPLCVDVALEFAFGAKQDLLWRYTQRDIDFAFYGSSPVTDMIGEFGVRFRAMLADHAIQAGKEIVEAVPAATIELMEFRGQYRDGSAHFSKGAWKADDKTRRNDKLMAVILTELGVNPGQGAEKVSSDDLDAMLCALTALAIVRGEKLLRGPELAADVARRCERRANLTDGSLKATVPASAAVLAAPFWDSLTITRG